MHFSFHGHVLGLVLSTRIYTCVGADKHTNSFDFTALHFLYLDEDDDDVPIYTF